MTEHNARSILRLIAVVIMMVGLCLTAVGLIGLVGAGRAMQTASGMQIEMTGMVAEMGLFAILAYVSITALGGALFAFSPGIAPKIVE